MTFDPDLYEIQRAFFNSKDGDARADVHHLQEGS